MIHVDAFAGHSHEHIRHSHVVRDVHVPEKGLRYDSTSLPKKVRYKQAQGSEKVKVITIQNKGLVFNANNKLHAAASYDDREYTCAYL